MKIPDDRLGRTAALEMWVLCTPLYLGHAAAYVVSPAGPGRGARYVMYCCY